MLSLNEAASLAGGRFKCLVQHLFATLYARFLVVSDVRRIGQVPRHVLSIRSGKSYAITCTERSRDSVACLMLRCTNPLFA
jgi:hypothetical protein